MRLRPVSAQGVDKRDVFVFHTGAHYFIQYRRQDAVIRRRTGYIAVSDDDIHPRSDHFCQRGRLDGCPQRVAYGCGFIRNTIDPLFKMADVALSTVLLSSEDEQVPKIKELARSNKLFLIEFNKILKED